MTSGGVSVGDADYVRDIVERLGRIEFWKIAIKPGKPLAYGRIGDCHFFGLPGNPVSTIVTFLMLVKPILATLAGAQDEIPLKVEAKLSCDIAHEPGRVEYQRGAYSIGAHGISVQPTSDQSSNRIGSFRGANCLIEVPRISGNLARGTSIAILPLTGSAGVTLRHELATRTRSVLKKLGPEMNRGETLGLKPRCSRPKFSIGERFRAHRLLLLLTTSS